MTHASLETVSPAFESPTDIIRQAMNLLASAVSADAQTLALTSPQTLVTPSDVLREMGAGRPPRDLSELGFPIAGSRVVVLRADTSLILDRLWRLGGRPARAVAYTTDREIVILVPGAPRESGIDKSLRDARRLVAALRQRWPQGWVAGISSRISGLSAFADFYRDAADAAALAHDEDELCCLVDDVWARLSCERLRQLVRSAMTRNTPLDQLERHDLDNNTSFAFTVGTWLEAGCDSRATAKILCIHPNTLRYRLRRAAAIAAIDLDDPDQRLLLQLTHRGRPRPST